MTPLSLFILLVIALPSRFTGTVGGASLGEPVLSVMRGLGSPSLVQTTDEGHEWRWFNAHGVDIDLLTGDDLVIRQILVSRPEALEGKSPPLIQPAELPLLGLPVADAEKALTRAGAQRQVEPEDAVSAWRFDNVFVVLERDGQRVSKILALDATSARQLGYAGGSLSLSAHRAPRLLHQPAVDYPRRAIQNRAEGVVIIRVIVGTSGMAKDASVLVSSGNADIDDAELQSMRRAAFRPARCNGQPCDGIYLDREEYTLGP